jgi:hypothetical protein
VLGYDQIKMSVAELRAFINSISSISIKPYFEVRNPDGMFTAVLDGTRYELTIFGGMHGEIRISWHGAIAPSIWKELISLTMNFVDKLSPNRRD